MKGPACETSLEAFQHGDRRSAAYGKGPRRWRVYLTDFAPEASPVTRETPFPKHAGPPHGPVRLLGVQGAMQEAGPALCCYARCSRKREAWWKPGTRSGPRIRGRRCWVLADSVTKCGSPGRAVSSEAGSSGTPTTWRHVDTPMPQAGRHLLQPRGHGGETPESSAVLPTPAGLTTAPHPAPRAFLGRLCSLVGTQQAASPIRRGRSVDGSQ